MFRRWIIRSLCIALLTLCVTVWAGSYFRAIAFQYHGWGEYDPNVSVGCGIIDIDYTVDILGNPHTWWFSGPADAQAVEKLYEATQHHAVGFAYHRYMNFLPSWALFIPLWFPTTLSAGFLWLVWRKTRPKYTGKGFPVEPAAQPTKP